MKSLNGNNFLEGDTVVISSLDGKIPEQTIILSEAIHVDHQGLVVEPKDAFQAYLLDSDGYISEGLAAIETGSVQVTKRLSKAPLQQMPVESNLESVDLKPSTPRRPTGHLCIRQLSSESVAKLNQIPGIRKLTVDGGEANLLNDLNLQELLALELYQFPQVDFAKLKQLTKLQFLTIVDCGTVDLAGIENLQRLTSLKLRGSTVNGLESLQSLRQLQRLDLHRSNVPDEDAVRFQTSAKLRCIIPPL